MKSQFNSKMSNSPFYVGPSVYVGNDGWSFSKKDKKTYKYLTFALIVSIAVFVILV